MIKNILNQRGFSHIVIPIFVIILAITGFAGYRVMQSSKDTSAKPANTGAQAKTAATTANWPTRPAITWEATGGGTWISLPYDTPPPACPDPISLNLPTTDIKQATSILYPGQYRTGTFEGKGGTYKPHGGIRFDNSSDNNVNVVMPFNGSVFQASRFLVDGEIQYSFDIANDCGVMIRLGHLHDLTPAFQAIVDKLPTAVEGDSRNTKVTPNVAFKTGAAIATAVGFKNTKNVGFDYGLYDLRSDNAASQNPAYKAAHGDTAELSSHALCWLNNLNSADQKIVKALPAGDSTSGKTSDYCK